MKRIITIMICCMILALIGGCGKRKNYAEVMDAKAGKPKLPNIQMAVVPMGNHMWDIFKDGDKDQIIQVSHDPDCPHNLAEAAKKQAANRPINSGK